MTAFLLLLNGGNSNFFLGCRREKESETGGEQTRYGKMEGELGERWERVPRRLERLREAFLRLPESSFGLAVIYCGQLNT